MHVQYIWECIYALLNVNLTQVKGRSTMETVIYLPPTRRKSCLHTIYIYIYMYKYIYIKSVYVHFALLELPIRLQEEMFEVFPCHMIGRCDVCYAVNINAVQPKQGILCRPVPRNKQMISVTEMRNRNFANVGQLLLVNISC